MAYERPLQIFGILVILYFYIKLVLFAWLYIRPSSIHRYVKDIRHSKEPNWALITGASDGIGEAFAGEICRRGFNVVLHGRNRTKLERVESSLNQRYPECQTKIVIFDANLAPSSSLEPAIIDQVKDLKLSVLINNIGGTVGVQREEDTYGTVDNMTVEVVAGLLNINARFTSQITALLLPLLANRPKSLIMNISSVSSYGMPYLGVYSGTKSYITAWSKALTLEMKAEKRSIEVIGILVGSVQTAVNNNPLSFFHPTPQDFVRATVERVGCRQASVFGYLPHALQAMPLSFLPASITDMILVRTMKRIKHAADTRAKVT